MKNLDAAMREMGGARGPSGAMRAALKAVGVDPDGEAPVPQGETVEPRWWETGVHLPNGWYWTDSKTESEAVRVHSFGPDVWGWSHSSCRRFGPFATRDAARRSYDAMQATQNARVYKAGEHIPRGVWNYAIDKQGVPIDVGIYKQDGPSCCDRAGLWPDTPEGERECRKHYAAAVEAAKVAKQPAPASEEYGWVWANYCADLTAGSNILAVQSVAREATRRAELRWAEEREKMASEIARLQGINKEYDFTGEQAKAWQAVSAWMRDSGCYRFDFRKSALECVIESLNALRTERDELARKLEQAQPQPVASGELVVHLASALAHRGCCGTEHDPASGKLHGYCVVCGVPWPCATAQVYLTTRLEALEAQGKDGGE